MATIVKAKRDESTDSVIRRFKRRVLIDNTLPLVREKEFYKKPALKRKEHKKEIERKKYHEKMLAKGGRTASFGKKAARRKTFRRPMQ